MTEDAETVQRYTEASQKDAETKQKTHNTETESITEDAGTKQKTGSTLNKRKLKGTQQTSHLLKHKNTRGSKPVPTWL